MKAHKLHIYERLMTAVFAAAMMLALPACDDMVYSDLDPCPPTGASVRFVYDYNMEKANAFPSQVDCLTLYVYNGQGENIATFTETTEVLADEDYRLPLELAPGEYTLVAHGGLACEHASFSHTADPGHKISDIQTVLNPGCLTDPALRNLHAYFFGTEEMTIREEEMTNVTVKMMRNTNDIQVALQHLHGSPVDVNDFNFAITDDNTLFRHDNMLLPAGAVTYTPWITENRSTGMSYPTTNGVNDAQPVQVALAELSVSRIMTHNSPVLRVTRVSDGKTVIDIPLINYMLLFKSAKHKEMGNQEYLDRENRWSFLFFLDDTSQTWLQTSIKVNDWTVRVNNTDFE